MLNPKKVKVQTANKSVNYLVEMIKQDQISGLVESAHNTWTLVEQSLFIESLLLQIPIQSFYFESVNNGLAIVDGNQRILAIRNFVETKELKLSSLEYFEQYNGFGFNDLPRALQRTIEQTNVTCFILQKDLPLDIRENLLKRILCKNLRIS